MYDQLVMAAAMSLERNVQRICHHRIARAHAQQRVVDEHQRSGLECRQTLTHTRVFFYVPEIPGTPRPEHSNHDYPGHQRSNHSDSDYHRFLLPTHQGEYGEQGEKAATRESKEYAEEIECDHSAQRKAHC